MHSKTRPNILMFIPHDCGDHLACYGHGAVKSPNLDRLAEEGVRFERCCTATPECTPSRAGLGYNCTSAQQTAGSTDAVCAEVGDFLKSTAAAGNRPWFACVGLQDTHRPWRPARDFRPEDVVVPPYLPDMPEARADLTELYQAVFDMDTAIGRVLDTLYACGLAQNTVVVYTSDHGISFPRAKSTFYEAGIRVPLILRWLEKQEPFPPPPAEELYDPESDPLEQLNLAGSGRHGAVLSDLKDRLESMLRRAGSPLPDGHVSPDLSATGNERW